ncbi:TonB-dependent receptor [candidate division WOR-3 bacterium]|nr:TonB-dependent receptor [candidate division WOR-3 bacterium]
MEGFFISGFVFISLFRLTLESAALYGVVKDAADLSPIEAASIFVDERLVCITGPGGEFHVQSIPWGQHMLSVRRIGYEKRVFFLEIEQTETRQMFVFLESQSIEAEGITVWGEKRTEGNIIIIDSENIEGSGCFDLPDVLEGIAGVTISRQNAGDVSSVSLSGPSAGRVGIYVDGVKVNSAVTGAFDLSSIPITSVKRIVVVNNPGAGSEPGGRIMIFLKGQEREENEISVLSGSYGLIAARLGFGSGFPLTEKEKISLDVSFDGYSGGYPAEGYPGGVISNSDSKSLRGVMRIFSYFIRKIELSVAGSAREKGIPGQADGTLMTLSRMNDCNFTAWAKLPVSFFGVPCALSVSHGLTSNFYFCPERQPIPGQNDSAYFFPESSETVSTRTDMSLNFTPSVSSWAELIIDCRWNNQNYFFRDGLRDFLPEIRARRSEIILSLATILTKSLGVCKGRLDFELAPSICRANGKSKVFWSYSAGLNISSHSSTSVSSGGVGFSRNIHYPDFSNTHTVETVYSSGNPDLKPEISNTLGLNFNMTGSSLPGWSFSVSGFYGILEDMIVWRRNFKGQYQPFNLGKAKGLGCDFYLSADIPAGFYFKLGLSLQDVKNRTGGDINYGNYITYRPVYRFSSETGYKRGVFSAEVLYRAVARRYTREANTDPLGISNTSLNPYRVFDVFVSCSRSIMHSEWTFVFSVKNIFDDRYMVVEQMPVEGRIFKTEVSVKW